MDAESIAHGLDKPRFTGKSWLACCAAHDDKNPSLAITDGEDGKVLVHCFSGCSQEAVIEALRTRGLWPDATPQQKYNAEQKERRRLIEHHRLILRLASSDMKRGIAVTDKTRKEILASIDFLARSK